MRRKEGEKERREVEGESERGWRRHVSYCDGNFLSQERVGRLPS